MIIDARFLLYAVEDVLTSKWLVAFTKREWFCARALTRVVKNSLRQAKTATSRVTCNQLIDGFVHLSRILSRDGKVNSETERSLNAARKIVGRMWIVANNKLVTKVIEMEVHNIVLIPTLLYGCEAWIFQKNAKVGRRLLE